MAKINPVRTVAFALAAATLAACANSPAMQYVYDHPGRCSALIAAVNQRGMKADESTDLNTCLAARREIQQWNAVATILSQDGPSFSYQPPPLISPSPSVSQPPAPLSPMPMISDHLGDYQSVRHPAPQVRYVPIPVGDPLAAIH
jgi:hypothetical protein